MAAEQPQLGLEGFPAPADGILMTTS